MQNFFFEASNDLRSEIESLNEVALPMCSALWNFRKTIAGEYAENESVSLEHLKEKYNDAPGARRSANLRLAFIDTSWEEQLKSVSELYLIGIISTYEYWTERLTSEMDEPSLYIKLQFPSNSTRTNGVGFALNEMNGTESDPIRDEVYPSLVRSSKYSIQSLEALLKCFRYFKELRNCLLHRGKLCDGKLYGAQSEFLPYANEGALGMKFVPDFQRFQVGDTVSLSFNGVLGFTEVILRIVATVDAEVAKGHKAEAHIARRASSYRNPSQVDISDIPSLFNEMGIPDVRGTRRLLEVLQGNS